MIMGIIDLWHSEIHKFAFVFIHYMASDYSFLMVDKIKCKRKIYFNDKY